MHTVFKMYTLNYLISPNILLSIIVMVNSDAKPKYQLDASVRQVTGEDDTITIP